MFIKKFGGKISHYNFKFLKVHKLLYLKGKNSKLSYFRAWVHKGHQNKVKSYKNKIYFIGWTLAKFGSFLLWMIIIQYLVHLLDKIRKKKKPIRKWASYIVKI
jgi:hypothetical protein